MLIKVGYKLCCLNEWCSGPPTWKVVADKPEEPQRCPTCGWSAFHGDGIKPIYEEVDA